MSASLRNTIYNSLRRRNIRCQKNYPILNKYGMVSLIDVAVLNDNGYPKGLIKCTKRAKQGTSDKLVFHNFEVMKRYGVPAFIVTEGRPEGYTTGLISSLKQVCRASGNVSTGKYEEFRQWSSRRF